MFLDAPVAPTSLRHVIEALERLHDHCRDTASDYNPLLAHEQVATLLLAKLLADRAGLPLVAPAVAGRATTRWFVERFRALTAGSIGEGAGGDPSDLAPETIERCLATLSRFDFSAVPQDVLSAAYEAILADDFRGALGQYFTPRPVVEFMVALASPSARERVVDHAAGAAGFLTTCLRTRPGTEGPERVTGIERSASLVRIANLALALQGGRPFHGRVFRGDTLDEVDGGIPVTAAGGAADVIPFASFDCVLSNPPFGQRASPDVASGVARGRFGRDAPREHEALFLLRAVDLLEPGGRVAIVLPVQLLWGKKYRSLQQWLLGACHVRAVVRLPKETFLPFGSAIKCVILLAEKKKGPAPAPEAFLGFACHVGFDASGERVASNDLPGLAVAFHTHDGSPIAGWEPVDSGAVPDPLVHSIKRASASVTATIERAAGRLSCRVEPLGTLVRVVKTRGRSRAPADVSSHWVIEGEHIDRVLGEVVGARGTTSRPAGATVVRPGDILYLRMRPYLRKVALVPDAIASSHGASIRPATGTVWAAGEFAVLRTRDPRAGILPEYLHAYLRTDLFLWQMLVRSIGATRPRVSTTELLGGLVLIPSPDRQREMLAHFDLFRKAYEGWMDQKERLVGEYKALQRLDPALGGQGISVPDEVGLVLEKSDLRPKSHSREFY